MDKLKKSLIFSLLIGLLTLQFLACPVLSVENPVYQKGLSYSAWDSDSFGGSESDESLRLLTETNTEWIAICFSWFQTSTTSHDIHIDPTRSPTTESVLHSINTAHSLGLKVMLKPMVEANEREDTRSYPVWRGEIEPSEEWFESYSIFLNFFADFAEQNGVEMFCVGCEYKETTGEKEQWESVIQGVRERYSGPITYAADWTNYQNIGWWSSVDYVGIDAYFPLSLFDSDPTLEDLKTVWNNHADDIEEWLEAINKPVIFTEIGYRSGDGTSMAPANYWTDMAVDLQEQVDCYEAAFQTLWERNWFYGFYWWTWIHIPTRGGPDDSNHTPQNKPVQDTITSWYSRDKQVAVIDQAYTSTDKCGVDEVQFVGFHAGWQNDGTDVVGGSVYVNGTEYVTNGTGWVLFSVSYDKVGEHSWVVTDFEHPEASGYVVSVESPSILWDEVEVSVESDSGLGVTKVRVTVSYVYSGDSVTGAIIVVNGEECEETEPGIYETEISSWSPIEQLTVKTDAADISGETFTTVINVINILVFVAVLVVVIVIVALLLRRRGNDRI